MPNSCNIFEAKILLSQKEEGRRKKEEGRRKKEEAVIAMVSAIKNVLTVLAVAINFLN